MQSQQLSLFELKSETQNSTIENISKYSISIYAIYSIHAMLTSSQG